MTQLAIGGDLMHRVSWISVVTALMYGVAPSAEGAPQYNIVALDVLPGGLDSLAFGLNDVGQVVGASILNRSGNIGQSRPVVWDYSGVPHELWSDQSVGGSLADINNGGEIVGRYGSGSVIPLPTSGVPGGRAFYWSATTGRVDIGLEPFGNSQAVAINDSGQVAGTSEKPSSSFEVPHAFIWDADNGIRELGSLGGQFTFANAMNNLGQVVGYGDLANGNERAFIWDEQYGMRELPTLNGGETRAIGVNDSGDVLIAESGFGSYIWNQTRGFTLDPIGGFAFNNLDQIVGGTIGDPSIWDTLNGKHRLTDLIPSGTGWRLEIPFAIDDAGEIVGYGVLNGQVRGFLLIPVPEPNSLSLFLVCVLRSVFVRQIA